jgi:hypothetical protein
MDGSYYMVVSITFRTERSAFRCIIEGMNDVIFDCVGSVSVGVWQMACRRVIKVGERVVKDLASTRNPLLLSVDLQH